MPDDFDAELALFAQEFVPNVQASAYYPRWVKSAPADAARWVAFRDAVLAGGTPVPPSMATKFGKALVRAGEMHMTISRVVGLMKNMHPTPPPAETFQNGTMLWWVGGGVADGVTGLGNYGCVVLAAYRYANVVTIKAAYPNCKVLMYRTLADMHDIGVGAVVPTQQQRFGARTSITYNEAQVHDATYPSDKWILTTNGSTPCTPWFLYTNVYGGNMAQTSFREQLLARVREQLAAQPLWDGVFFDNVLIRQWNLSNWPFELSSESAFMNATVAITDYVGSALRGDGKIVAGNAADVYPPWDEQGLQRIAWWQQLGTLGALDVMYAETGLQRSNDLQVVSLQGGATYSDFWENKIRYQSVAQDVGASGVTSLNLGGSLPLSAANIAGRQARYVKASTFLNWNGQGLHWVVQSDPLAGFNPWQGAVVTFDLGQPVGSYSVSDGVYIRQAENGWVAVNPTAYSKTVTVGGTSRTIPSGDAYIGT